MTDTELKQKILQKKELEKKKAEIAEEIKALEEEILAESNKLLEEANSDVVKNPFFTITKTTENVSELKLDQILAHQDAKNVVIQFVSESSGKGWKITAAKTFEKMYKSFKDSNPNLPEYTDFCKNTVKDKVSVELRPDVPVEEEMQI